jgi:hypothetical protein
MRVALFSRRLGGARLPQAIAALFARASAVARHGFRKPPEIERHMTPRTRQIHAALNAAIARRQSR